MIVLSSVMGLMALARFLEGLNYFFFIGKNPLCDPPPVPSLAP